MKVKAQKSRIFTQVIVSVTFMIIGKEQGGAGGSHQKGFLAL